MRTKRWLWIGLGLVILAAVAIIVVFNLPDKKMELPAAVQSTAKASIGDIAVSVSGSGSVISTDSETVRTKDEGKVKKVFVEAGNVVKKGQVLLTFESNDLTENLESQQRNLKSQQLDLQDLQEQFKQKVADGGTEEELTSIKKSIAKQELNIQSTETEIASIREDMAAPEPLTSPIDGTVTSVNITAGEQAKTGTELFVINNYQDLSVAIQVDELDIPNVKPGMKTTVQIDALPDQTFEGEVSEIADEGVASNGVSLFDVTIKLLKAEGIRVGMSAEATVILEEKKDVLTLPIEAVQQRGEKYIVLLPSASPAAGSTEQEQTKTAEPADSASPSGRKAGAPANGNMKEIEVGAHNETLIEIVSGLNEGDEVVIPTVRSSGNSTANQQGAIPAGGMEGFGNGGGQMPGGGGMGVMPGGGGGMPRGGASSSGGGGGGRE
ncbi:MULTISPECIES: efflux RND transporter periplasmic adaptor subunit [Paenibacillus]|uniref:efflux RND transporter periplasmic adaptor subunit n=1 Tax=Paenibacillus TaxID=44249 RepID=UPI002FE19075